MDKHANVRRWNRRPLGEVEEDEEEEVGAKLSIIYMHL